MNHNKIHSISSDCPRPSITLQKVQKHGLKCHSYLILLHQPEHTAHQNLLKGQDTGMGSASQDLIRSVHYSGFWRHKSATCSLMLPVRICSGYDSRLGKFRSPHHVNWPDRTEGTDRLFLVLLSQKNTL